LKSSGKFLKKSYTVYKKQKRREISLQIEVKIDSDYKIPKVVIFTDQMSDEVDSILKKLSEDTPRVISGFCGDSLEILEQESIVKIYCAAGKVYAAANGKEYALRLRLYELEKRLDPNSFVRISNSEIVNLKKAVSFDLSLAGTIRVSLSDGSVSFVSRRYVAAIKRVLGI